MDMTRQDAFLLDLGILFEKYGVRVDAADNYDGVERYCGTEYSLDGDGIYVDISKVEFLMSQALKERG
jgi:hypothetical protein